MKKRNKGLLISLMLIVLILLTVSAYAYDSELYMINDSGEKISSYQLIETGKNIDLGKVRIREDVYTVGKLKEGDRIALILTNANFASTPEVMAPPTSLDNQYGRTGDFDLVKVPGTGEAGNNAVIYELKKLVYILTTEGLTIFLTLIKLM